MSRKFVLVHNRSPGDIVVLTALVRDLKLAHPEFQLGVDTTCKDLWRHNPHVTLDWLHQKNKSDITFVKCDYSVGIREQNRETVHFIPWFHRDFKTQTSINVPLTKPFGDLHLSDEERNVSLLNGRYWVTISGGKSDFTIKPWRVSYLQEVVNRVVEKLGVGVVQIGSTDSGHWHPPLDNVVNLVGRSNLRDMLRLIQHAEGVICGVTGAMHMAAALEKPCVVFGGGREAWWWEAYVNENKGFGNMSGTFKVPHRYLHTIGLLSCCRHHGCWRNKVVKINDDKSVCEYPVLGPQPIALCMDMITPDHVWEAVQSYYKDGTLAPVDSQRQLDLTPDGHAHAEEVAASEAADTITPPATLSPITTPARKVLRLQL